MTKVILLWFGQKIHNHLDIKKKKKGKLYPSIKQKVWQSGAPSFSIQLHVFWFQSQIFLSCQTFHIFITSELKMELCKCSRSPQTLKLPWIDQHRKKKTQTRLLRRRIREILPQNLVLFWSFQCLWCQAELWHAMQSLVACKLNWPGWSGKVQYFCYLIFISISGNPMTADKLLIFPNEILMMFYIVTYQDEFLKIHVLT